MELDRIPLRRWDLIVIRQIVENFTRYIYLPRLKNSAVLLDAIRDGLVFSVMDEERFRICEQLRRNRGPLSWIVRGRLVFLVDTDAPDMLVKPEVARRQLEMERPQRTSRKQPTGLPASDYDTTAQ